MKHQYKRDAKRELLDAVQHYKDANASLGSEFLDQVGIAIERIKSAPERWPANTAGIRSCLVHRFPYRLYYRIQSDVIQIVAVAHHRRRPDYWSQRLD